MSPERRRAYAWIMYRALLDIRLSAWATLPPRPWSPSWWRRAITSLRDVERISDALHNLPEFMSREFAGFDEDLFWCAFVDVADEREQGSPLRGYREEFEAFLRRDSQG